MNETRMRSEWRLWPLSFTAFAICGIAMSTAAFAQESKSIGVRVVDKAGYDKVIASNKGKVIVVDCWATWCVPCRKAFPKTAAFHEKMMQRPSIKDTVPPPA